MNCVNLFVKGNWRELVYMDDEPAVGNTIPIRFVKTDHSTGTCVLRVKKIELTTDLEENPLFNAYCEEIK